MKLPVFYRQLHYYFFWNIFLLQQGLKKIRSFIVAGTYTDDGHVCQLCPGTGNSECIFFYLFLNGFISRDGYILPYNFRVCHGLCFLHLVKYRPYLFYHAAMIPDLVLLHQVTEPCPSNRNLNAVPYGLHRKLFCSEIPCFHSSGFF